MKPALSLTVMLAFAAPLAGAADLKSCRALADASARLACYDALPLDAAPATQTDARPKETPQNFGMALAAKDQLEGIDSGITGLFEGWGPRSLLRLDNGQLWRIADGSSGVMYVTDPKVHVRRGMMGAFYMDFVGTKQSPRVERLK